MDTEKRGSMTPVRGGPIRVFLENRLAVLGLAVIAVFALMVIAHPLLMVTLWAGKSSIYDPITGYDAPIVVATVVETVKDPSTEIAFIDARVRGNLTAKVGDVVEIRIQPAPPAQLTGLAPMFSAGTFFRCSSPAPGLHSWWASARRLYPPWLAW